MTITKDDLVGAWRLVSADEVFADGRRRPEFGGNAAGYLSYSPDGIVSATLGDMNRPRSGASDPQSASDEELASMAHGFMSYAGPFTIDPDNDTVTHHIAIALFVDWQQGPQKRIVRIVDDRLHIIASPRTAPDGRTFHSELVWERV